VPRGLRSFDGGDADFFLELLPGPRDRDGLPAGLRFWKARIEEADPDRTFAVGLLYGPSGCGKSSLVKAGLLPRLAGHVLSVYVEATARDTEARLLRALHRHFPTLADDAGLVESVTELRRGGRPDQKVLIVLDQFEQWLHARRTEDDTDLVRALRQCDGGRVQAVVLVRDDFWMAATRFMRDLEVPLVEGHSSAAVDLFEPRHARKVLAAFGRAYGALPEGDRPPDADETRFLAQAVEGLTRDGKVVPVRLALFAEMVKGRPWRPATLRAVGGAAGIGVAFLEETFASPTAPPEHRLHARAAQAVLKALLPEHGTDIKGNLRSEQELLAASGYAGRPGDFSALLALLDAELRLLTPTDRAEVGAGAAGEAPARFYQLTHDYLVPSLRDWLTRKQKETRGGRAELRLAERAALWNDKPQNRHLPAWWEWLSIRLGTRKKDWTAPQQRMMRKAARYHLLRGAALAVLLLGLGAAGLIVGDRIVEHNRSAHAAGLVRSLLDAETSQIPDLVAELEGYRPWADPLLRREHEQAAPGSRQQLRTALALLVVDPTQADYLVGRLLDAESHEVAVLVAALRPHRDDRLETFWAAGRPGPGKEGRRLRAAAALADYAPDDPRWDRIIAAVADDLVRVPATHLGAWLEALRPVRVKLLGPLAAIFGDPRRRETERSLATDVLAEYAARRPELLADLILQADEKPFAVLLPRLLAFPEQAARLMTRELERRPASRWQDRPLEASWSAPPASLVRQVEQADGLLGERFALVQTLPRDRFDALAKGLAACGYRPTRLRPFTVAGQPGAPDRCLIAAVWVRDGKAWQYLLDAPADLVEKRDSQLRKAGLRPCDVAGYRPSTLTHSPERYAALWTARKPGEWEGRLLVGGAEVKVPAAIAREQGVVVRTLTAFTGADGRLRFCAVFGKKSELLRGNVYWSWNRPEPNLDSAVFALHPRDLAVSAAPPAPEVPPGLLAELEQLRLRARTEKTGVAGLLTRRGAICFRLGRDGEAREDLQAALTVSPEWPPAYLLRGLIHARRGETERARRDLGRWRRILQQPGVKELLVRGDLFLPLYVSSEVWRGRHEEAVGCLDDALKSARRDPDALYTAARSGAQAAHWARLNAFAATCWALAGTPRAGACGVPLAVSSLAGVAILHAEANRARAYADRALAALDRSAERGFLDFDLVRTDPDLAPLRPEPRFAALLARAHLDRCYLTVSQGGPVSMTAVAAYGLSPAEQRARGRELAEEGYRPVTISATSTRSDRPVVTASVWQRPSPPGADRDALARRQANAAAVLLHLGRPGQVWPLLQHTPVPDLRSHLVHRLGPLAVDPGLLIDRLKAEADPSARRALVLALGEYTAEHLPRRLRRDLTSLLLRWYRDDPDPGVHGAIDWLLRHDREGPLPRKLSWRQRPALERIDSELAGKGPAGRGWYVNGLGQTMVCIPEPAEFLMGTPPDDPDWLLDEPLRRERITHGFAIAAREVSRREFLAYLRATRDRGSLHYDLDRLCPDPEGAMPRVSWFDAIKYCRWLSERDGVSEDQMCYPPIREIEQMERGLKPWRLPVNLLQRTGYRLSTDMEWEYACRAGSTSSRFFGSTDRLLGRYAWYVHNSSGRTWPGGQKKPNDLGLFDLYGNVYEWCQDGSLMNSNVRVGLPLSLSLTEGPGRVMRGGSFDHQSYVSRSSMIFQVASGFASSWAGFRVARTLR
jgi:formylglycine-generating enzyme required for sulfatase activity/tetratricopeptide (TPR) repeat protein